MCFHYDAIRIDLSIHHSYGQSRHYWWVVDERKMMHKTKSKRRGSVENVWELLIECAETNWDLDVNHVKTQQKRRKEGHSGGSNICKCKNRRIGEPRSRCGQPRRFKPSKIFKGNSFMFLLSMRCVFMCRSRNGKTDMKQVRETRICGNLCRQKRRQQAQVRNMQWFWRKVQLHEIWFAQLVGTKRIPKLEEGQVRRKSDLYNWGNEISWQLQRST